MPTRWTLCPRRNSRPLTEGNAGSRLALPLHFLVLLTAAFPDADFEMYPATAPTTAYSYIPDGQEAHGWHAVVPGLIGDSTADSAVFFFDQRLGR